MLDSQDKSERVVFVMSPDDKRLLAALAATRRTSVGAVLRQLVVDEARREGIEQPAGVNFPQSPIMAGFSVS